MARPGFEPVSSCWVRTTEPTFASLSRSESSLVWNPIGATISCCFNKFYYGFFFQSEINKFCVHCPTNGLQTDVLLIWIAKFNAILCPKIPRLTFGNYKCYICDQIKFCFPLSASCSNLYHGHASKQCGCTSLSPMSSICGSL